MDNSPKKTSLTREFVSVGIVFIIMSAVFCGEGKASSNSLHPQALESVGLYPLREIDPNLTGSGVKIGLICRSLTYSNSEPENNYRPFVEHKCLRKKDFNFFDDGSPAADISPHSSAVSSILFGEDANAYHSEIGGFTYEGAVPGADGEIHEFWHFLINNVFPAIAPEADVLTASFGSRLEDWWTRGIQSMAEQYGISMIAGIGNGLNAQDEVLHPGAGENTIGVGVVEAVITDKLSIELSEYALAYPEHSSFGPTDDGRCKPDIVAPGNCLAAEVNGSNNYVATGSWASFSTPIVTGAVSLLIQKAKENPVLSPILSPYGGNTAIKAILLNSATKLPYWHKGKLTPDDDHTVPLDYIQGSGMLNTLKAYYQFVSGLQKPGLVQRTGWDLNTLESKENPENSYLLLVTNPSEQVITVTTAWNKHFSSIYPFEHLYSEDANLRLELWAVDPNEHNRDYLLDYSDSDVDNVEHIHTPADANFSVYAIVVSYSNPEDPNQTNASERYGIAWNVEKKKETMSFLSFDLNPDGIINEADYFSFFNNMQLSSEEANNSYILGDLNGDGLLNSKDFVILLQHQNETAEWYSQQNQKL